MRKPQLAAIVLTAAAGIAMTGALAGTAYASEVAPSQNAPAATPVAASPSPSATKSSDLVGARVSNVDLAKGTITVTVTINGKDSSITLNIPKTTKVVVNGVQTTLANLPVGAKVNVGSSNGALTLNATTDTSKLNTLVGSLAAVDLKSGTVKVNLPSGGSQTLPVAANAKVTLDGTDVALSGLPVGARVTLGTSDLGKGQVVTRIEAHRATTSSPAPTASATSVPATSPTSTKPVVAPTTTVKPVATPTATSTAAPTTTVKPTVKASAGVR